MPSQRKNNKKQPSQKQLEMEKQELFSHIGKILSEKNFASMEEANEFLNTNFTGKSMDELVPKKRGRKSKTEKANDLVREALAIDNIDEKISKLNQALKLDPENVNALIDLGDTTDSPEDAIVYYQKAMDKAAGQLGPDYFEENRGHFWGLWETRPYMNAKFRFADCLSAMGMINETITEFQEMLELNPNDNQGIRYLLSTFLLINNNINDYKTLYRNYNDDSAAGWLFDYAYFLFITEGPSKRANNALKKANNANKHVLQIMSGKEEMAELTPYHSPGDLSEASHYIELGYELWAPNHGALIWAFDFIIKTNKKKY